MVVKEIMHTPINAINIKATVRQASQKMDALKVYALPVEDNNIVIGIITDRDIIVRCIAIELNPSSVLVGDVIGKELPVCREDMSIEEAAELMDLYKTNHLLVYNDSRVLSGIISLTDIALRIDPVIASPLLKKILKQ